ncbi:hypothetical protein AYO49_06030 [Verrucomicrobiaceae bacterium SCGC AG-212-N21]|nr:hypothetical protein AYO49_06030 [Verrucomicrobiaceae bacterium SCGC AG-212-N21]
MTDPYPSALSFEIDRENLRRYLRRLSLLLWLPAFVILSVFLSMASLQKALEDLSWRRPKPGDPSPKAEVARLVAKRVGVGLAIGTALGLLGYFCFSHRSAARMAATTTLSVDGPFLKVRHYSQRATGITDRKLHFRAIVDFATRQDTLMRWCGIEELSISTAGGITVAVLGVKDCAKVRDTLADIDQIRER